LTKLRPGFLLAVLASVVLVSCAYYNIFWMAESEYEKAIKREQYDFWDPYDQAPLQGESERLVDSSLERFGKLLVLYPGSRWADDALLLMGNCFLLKEEYQNALRKYDELIQLYASSDLAPAARYMKAYTLVRNGSHQQAVTILEGVSEDKENKDIRQRAAYLLGRIALERDDYVRAVEIFETYLGDFPKGMKVERVRLHLAYCLLQTGDPGRVIEVLEPLAGKRTETGYQAALKLGEAHRTLGENDTAIEIFERLKQEASEDSFKARATMETAKIMVARQETEEAVAVLDEAAEMATAGLAALKDEIVYTQGLVYEKELDNFESAIETYDKITKSKGPYAREAQKRSQALNRVVKFRGTLTDTVPDSPEEEASTRFKLGETYLEDLGLREEAFREFKTVADSFADIPVAAQAMLRTAEFLGGESDSAGEAYLRRVVELFPETVHANFARSRLGLELVDVKITKPVVWEDAQVLGPSFPAAEEDSLSVTGPELPGPPLPPEMVPDAPDTLGPARRRRPADRRPGEASPVTDLPGVVSTAPARPESADTSGLWDGRDSTRTAEPADTAGQGGRQRP
jgi:TolA-binding protein